MQREVEIYAYGICFLSACSSLSVEETTEQVNVMHPTGIESRWQLSSEETFVSGEANPHPCERRPETHKHYLFEC